MSKANELLAGGEKSEKRSEEESWMDGINKLPDELLEIIVSHLTLKEAAACSILSRRWRYLWTFTGRLDFDGTKSLLMLKTKYRNSVRIPMGGERSKYVKWVNHVIALRNDSVPLHDFKVVFYVRKSHEEQMHEWIRYALEREVQTLELNLSCQGCPYFDADGDNFCSIPYSFLQETCSSIHFKLLKLRRVSLEYVNVSGEALEFLLCNCPSLEGLSVRESLDLETLRVIGPFPSLKTLEISSCEGLRSVEIRDVNLVCLKYSERVVDFVVENAPMLVELFVGTSDGDLDCRFRYFDRFHMALLHSCSWMDGFVWQFGRILDQLELLSIQLRIPEDCLCIIPNFRNLKQLVVTYLPTRFQSLLPVTNIIRAAPLLEKFVLKSRISGGFGEWRMEEKEMKNLYEKLKEVEFVGFSGEECELELVKHFVEKAAALQKITIHPESERNYLHQLLAAHVPHPIILEFL